MKLYVFPGNIEQDILDVAANQIPYMRTQEFSNIMFDCEKMFLEQIGCENGRLITLTASGTAAMDSVVCNYVTTKSKAFVIAGGSFGHRWGHLCSYYNVDHEIFKVGFAKDINCDNLDKALKESGADVLLCQHHETSTGQRFDIDKISNICKRNNVSLVVDAISSFLADDLNIDQMGIDICITSSQKGLNIAPGLSFIIINKSLADYKFNSVNYYLDYNENLKNLVRGQTPYSPATSIILQLHKRLLKNKELGLSQVVNDVKQRALYFRNLCKKYGWDMPVETPSNCITAFYVVRNGEKLFTELLKENIYIMPGGTPNYFRVSHLGVQTNSDLDALACAIHKIEMA